MELSRVFLSATGVAARAGRSRAGPYLVCRRARRRPAAVQRAGAGDHRRPDIGPVARSGGYLVFNVEDRVWVNGARKYHQQFRRTQPIAHVSVRFHNDFHNSTQSFQGDINTLTC